MHTEDLNITGRVVRSGDPDWDAVRLAFNVRIDQRPEAIVLPADADDVVAAVRYARDNGLRVAPQATAHNAAPPGSIDGAIIVHTSTLQEVSIDPGAQRVRVGAGVKWEKVTPELSNHGLAGLHGSSPDVGIAGYSLGGGMGWLARKYGLQTNSVTAFELVTADGEFIRATATNHADLFWALRGGGGSFGVVTSIEIALYPVTEAFAGWLIWPMERAAEVLGAWAEWTRDLPEEVTSVGRMLQLPPIPEMPEALRGRQVVVVEAAYLGDEASGRELLRPLRDLEPEIDTFATVPARGLTELHQDPPGPVPGAGDGWLLETLDAAAAAAIVESAAMDGTAPLLSLEIRHLDGALGRPDPNGGVLSHLEAPYAVYGVGALMGPVTREAVEARLREVRAASTPWAARTTYFNFADGDVDPSDLYPEGAFGRLAEIRATVDPDGLFRARHTI